MPRRHALVPSIQAVAVAVAGAVALSSACVQTMVDAPQDDGRLPPPNIIGDGDDDDDKPGPDDPGPIDPGPDPTPGDKCGNNIKDLGETCDGAELVQTTCGMLGFSGAGGVLACRGDCSDFDTSGCIAPTPPPQASPFPIAGPGGLIGLQGSLDLTDPSWARPSESCAAAADAAANRHFDVHRIVNNTGAPRTLTITGTFSADGFLHVYSGTFNEAQPTAGCVAGDDDGAAGTTESQVTGLAIAAGEVLTLVISSYGADVALGAYDLVVITHLEGGTPPPAAVCGDDVAEGAELCDGADLGGESCGAHGFNRGDVACNAGCSGVDVAGCWSIASPVNIAPRGSSVTLNGALEASDSKWRRPSETCAAASGTGGADRYFDALQIVNNTGSAQSLDLTATFVADGYLHVFSSSFEPTAPATSGCIAGDDDFNGSSSAQLLNVSIAPGQTLVVVASTFAANAAIGAFSVQVATRSPATCGNGVVEGSEVCDGNALAGQTCVGRGHEGGALSCSATCGAVVESACWDLEAAVPIAGPGGSVALDGELTAQDPRMDRVSESCSGSGPADHAWDGFRVVNNLGSAQTLTIAASWLGGGDGFLHAYRAGFDAAAPLSGCIKGDDDFGAAGSQLTGVSIAAGETLVIVASTFAGNANIGAYDIEVSTDQAPGTPIAAKGLTLQLAGSLDAGDGTYERLSEACAATGAMRKFDAHRIVNNTGVAQKLTVHGNWSGDGYLHVFEGTFNAGDPEPSCITGDDDFGSNASRIVGVNIAAGETLTVVASQFSSTGTLGAYTIDVLTEGDAATIATPGASILTKGALHASDAQWNRPSETCTDDGGTATNLFDVHKVKNTSSTTKQLDFTATWTGGDGFLVVYFGTFDPLDGAGNECIDGDDDFSGMTSSKVEGVTIFPGETLTVVATSYAASTSIPSYAIDVRTLP